MIRTRPSEFPKPAKWPLRLGFILIIAGFGLGNLVSMYVIRHNQTINRRTVEKTLASIQLLSQLERNLDRKRLLLYAHVLEEPGDDMTNIESQLTEIDADFTVAARSYDAIAEQTTERAAWTRLQGELAALRPGIENVIGLSRQNLDIRAREVMRAMAKQFETADLTMGDLIKVNRVEADNEVLEMATLQRRSRNFLAALTLSGIAFAMFAAIWSSRVIRHKEDQIKRAAILLEERNRDLDAFSGRVAHDLRGPLTTVNLAASRLAERAQEEGTAAILQRAVRQMETLIQDLLTLSSIHGQLPSAVSDTAQVASSVAQDLQPLMQDAAGVMNVAVEPAKVHCSAGLLRQVLWNLGENAIKYRRTDVPLEVEIHGRAKRELYEFNVSDNGQGMGPEEASHIFEPLFRGEHARSTPGTGLGLSIVKRVIEASGGAVSVESQPGRGTTFNISLPRERAA